MLESSITQVQEVRNSPPPVNFEVGGLQSSPLIEVGSASITSTRDQKTVDVRWEVGPYTQPAGFAEKILDSLIESARKDARRFPQISRVHANLALALLKAGRVDEAVVELELALSIDPFDYIAALTLARVNINRGDTHSAEAIFGRLLAVRPEDPNLHLGLAYLLIQRDEPQRAEELLRRALRQNEKLSYARFLLGVVRLRASNFTGAIGEFKLATRNDVRNSGLHHALGVAYAMVGDLGRAERAFRTALALSPHSASSVKALSRMLLDQRKPAEALHVLRTQVEATPGDVHARELLANAYFDLGKYSSARDQFQRILEAGGEGMAITQKACLVGNIATTLFLEHHPREAKLGFQKAIDLAPQASSIAYENLARVYFGERAIESALEVLFKASALFPRSEITRVLISTGYAELGHFRDAISELEPFLRSGEATADTYAHLGWLYSWVGDFESALSVAKAGNNAYPGVPGLINNLAYVYLQLGNIADAREVLQSLPRHIEPHAELIATQGLLRLWSDDLATAKLFYERASRRASELGKRNLSRKLRQKLHLELSKYFARKGDIEAAEDEIKRGLAIRVSGLSYEVHLKQMAKALPPAAQRQLFEPT